MQGNGAVHAQEKPYDGRFHWNSNYKQFQKLVTRCLKQETADDNVPPLLCGKK